MLHRALYGSLERFLGMLLEHHGAALPAWLAPQQVAVLPVAEEHEPWAREALAQVRRAGLRVGLDARSESLSRRVAEAHAAAVPWIAVAGAREVEAGALTLRSRDGSRALPLAAAVAALRDACAVPDFGG